MIDVTVLSYSDALRYMCDYLSPNPIYNVTDDDFHRMSETYGMDSSTFEPRRKRFKI